MLTQEQLDAVKTGYTGRIRGQVEGEFIHRCPVCSQVAVCNSSDKYHNCGLCGSTWRNPDYLSSLRSL